MTPSAQASEPSDQTENIGQAHWGAVGALSLGITGMVAAELLPISLLTPMATELKMSEGLAGQSMTVTGIVGLVMSLFTAALTQGFNRRSVMMLFSAALVISSLMVSFAPNVLFLMTGRVLLGFGTGGFWALAAASAMRLVPTAKVPHALSLMFGGGSLATVAAGPVGSYLEPLIGWRAVFLVTAGLGLIALIWQFVAFPAMTARSQARLGTLLSVLKRPQFGLGLLGIVLVFTGHFAFFTYVRPFLEKITHVNVNSLTAILLAYGLSLLFGTSMSGLIIERSLKFTLIGAPFCMSLFAGGLLLWGSQIWLTTALIALWGFAFALAPVAWSTWVTLTVPDEAETGGGLNVAAFQLAITLGAALGGLALDGFGPLGAFAVSGIVLFLASLTAIRLSFKLS